MNTIYLNLFINPFKKGIHEDKYIVEPSVRNYQKIEDLQNKKTQADYIKSQQVIAEEKRRVFTEEPIPPYDKGDLCF